MTRLLLFVSVLFFSFRTTAQLSGSTCINGRYSNDIFNNVTKTTDIIFGYNNVTDFSTGTTYPQTLRLDFYEPAGDVAVQRPLIILAFGGGFIRGQRQDLDSICLALAKKGYAAATIDYRLIYNSPFNYITVASSPSLLIDEVVKAVSDMKAAIRFFKRDASTTKTFRIDTTKIVIGGASAGAIAALHTAYIDNTTEVAALAPAITNNGGFEGNTDLPAPNSLLPTYNSRGIAAVINIAGGIVDTTAIGTNNPPVYSAHGSADEVVPYNFGQLSFQGTQVPLFLYGSNLITTRANNIGLKNQLYTIPNGNHESPGTQPYVSNVISQSAAFVQSIVCASALPVTLASFNVSANNCNAVLNWQTATESNNSLFEVEASANGINFIKVGNVNSKNSGNGANYTYKSSSYNEAVWFRIKTVEKDGTFTYSPVKGFTPNCITNFKISPNPAQALATVSGLQVGQRVSLISPEGKLLLKKPATGAMLQLSLSNLANGLYLIQVEDVNGKVLSSSRLIKN